ncbi:hypothetical protein GCM10009740_36750 [Terrabacter terrae]|uniref:Single-stranded DNA-binding protein n=1 Tax=Terrabacter terrae TaxID=318434 RepID=A0ABN2UPU8_9MICO
MTTSRTEPITAAKTPTTTATATTETAKSGKSGKTAETAETADTVELTDGAAAAPSSGARRTGRGAVGAGVAPPTNSPGRNEVHLSGRLAAEGEERELPSGDRIVTLRVVVGRAPAPARRRQPVEGPRRATVDTIDIVCWTATTRRTALRLRADDLVEVDGALRRRFFGGAAGRQSRYEVEATAVRRASGGARADT